MKSLLIIASFVALAVASPTHRGIVAGAAMLNFEPIADGHSIVHVDPTSIARAIVRGEPVTISIDQNAENVRSATSLIQIIVNVDGTTSVVNAPINVIPAAGAIVAEPEHNIEAGSAMLDFKPIAGGHSIVHVDPTSNARAIVKGDPVTVSIVQNAKDVRSATSLIQIIVNLDGTTTLVNAPINVYPAAGAIVAEPEHIVEDAPDSIVNAPINVYPAAGAIVAEPEHIVEDAPEAVQVVEAAPEPVQVIEVAPEPDQVVEVAPAPIGTPVLPIPEVPEVIPEPIAVGTPQLPIPVVVLPELN